ncbi:MAG: agmatine deiminase [Coriobacteriales bacterium]
MKTIYESESTPKADGFRMPAEFEPQTRVWMGWPHRTDTWAFGAKPAQKQYAAIARAIAEFTPVTMCANQVDFANCKAVFEEDENVTVIEMTTDDAWFRDTAATFVINDKGDKRACHWHFNAYGGFVDGLYFPWDKDEQIALKIAELAGCRRYRPDDMILEGGSITVDGEGTLVVTDMCLLSPGRTASATDYEPWSEELRAYMNEELTKYLNVEKVIWVKDGIDPEETNGHIDDVATFIAPGVMACIWTDDPDYPFYNECHAAYETLSNATDAKGRKLKVYKLPMPAKPLYMTQEACDSIDIDENAEPRVADEPLIASYMNYLVTNGGIITPQYGDVNDQLAIDTLQKIYDETWGEGAYKVVGVKSDQVVYGGGNIHCITQQEPAPQVK